MVKYFFFFKQKTANEMRISDWSSDVCSSDLQDINRQEIHGVHEQYPDKHRQRQWSEKFMAIAVEDALHLIINKIHQQLYDGLALVRHTCSRTAHDPPHQAKSYGCHHPGPYQSVHMQRPEDSLGARKSVVQGMSGTISVDLGGRH